MLERHLALALVSSLVLAAPARPPALVFAPAQGSVWRKTFERESSLELESFAVWMAGNEVPSEFLPDMELVIDEAETLEVIDTQHALGRRAPQRLERAYERIEREVLQSFAMQGSGMDASEDSQGEGVTDLAGRRVLFSLEEDGSYAREWVGEGGDDELLDGLDFDLDLLAFLPEDGVEVGDSWEADPGAVDGIMSTPAHLGVVLEGAGLDDVRASEAAQGEAQYDGELRVRFARVVEEEGVPLALLEVQGEVLVTTVSATDLDDVPVADGTATETTEADVSFEGELRWDLAQGVFRSFEITLETTLETRTVKDEGQPGPAYEGRMGMSGRATLSGVCQREE